MNNKYGFVYLWYDRKFKRYYVGCHWGTVDDGYICSSSWMKTSYNRRPNDFKRRILKSNIKHRPDMYIEEQKYLDMITEDEIKPKNPNPKYYNLSLYSKAPWHQYDEKIKTIGQKISAAKKGKKVKRPENVGEKISIAKRKKSAERKAKREYIESMCPELVFLRKELIEGRKKLIKIARSKSSKRNWQNMSDEAKEIRAKKLSEANKGCKGRKGQNLTEEHKKKISESRLGDKHWNKGKKWFNNGFINKIAHECPEGFKSGRL